MRTFALCTLLACASLPLHAQTVDDGIMMSRHSLQAGDIYTHDTWDQYWEGTLKRVNGNIGTITTETNVLAATYGVTNRLTLLGSVPYVWTEPSLGVLQGQSGFQDVMFGAKVSVFERSSPSRGAFRTIGVVYGGVPLTDYTPDFLPLSIGTQSRRLSGRVTLNYQMDRGIYVNGTGAYTVRGDVTLDRPYYYTNGQLFITDHVSMPNVVDWAVGVGYLKHDLNTNLTFSRSATQGGGDIRRQDMPFVSNRTIASRVGAMAMHPIPKIRTVAFYFSAARTVDGRNVGQSTTVAFGLLYSHASQGRLIR